MEPSKTKQDKALPTKIANKIAKWCVRASSAHKYVTHPPGLTFAQSRDLIELERKRKTKGLTKIQQNKMDKLIAKRDEPDTLPQGAKTEIQKELDFLMFGIKPEASAKQLEKGNMCEQDGLELLQSVYNYQHDDRIFLVKNEDSRADSDYLLRGTWDALYGETVIDIKVPWSLANFRAAELSEAYYWQLLTYCTITGAKKGLLAYCLVDTPEEFIYDEWRRKCYHKGIIDMDSPAADEIEAEVRNQMTFSDKLPQVNRVKTFEVEINEDDIELLKARAAMARKYMKELAVEHFSEQEKIPTL